MSTSNPGTQQQATPPRGVQGNRPAPSPLPSKPASGAILPPRATEQTGRI